MNTANPVANFQERLLSGGWEGWRRPILVSYVPAFFALSGFLVTGSALRTRVTSTFLAFRALRIFPALMVEVTLSALVLGACLTTLPLSAYFRDPQFFRYFGNIVGWITFELPGVFKGNPVPGLINVNLWTLPSEFDCYLITALLMISGLLYRRWVMTIALVAISVLFAWMNLFTDFAVTPTTLPPFAITYYFFVGVVFYHWRDRMPINLPLVLVCGAIGYVLQSGHHTVFIAPFFVTYVTLSAGLMSVPKISLISSGDYSYGIYLYGFPITQAVVMLVPGMQGNGWGTVGLSFLITCLFAAFSWHVIEKPMLNLKKRLPARFFPSSRPAIPATPEAREQAPANIRTGS